MHACYGDKGGVVCVCVWHIGVQNGSRFLGAMGKTQCCRTGSAPSRVMSPAPPIRPDPCNKEFLGESGQCGSGEDARSLDCRGCDALQGPSSRVAMHVVARKTRDEGVYASVLQEKGTDLPWGSKPRPVAHVGEDCWGPCISGYCPWCGEGHACCRQGFQEDLPECADAEGLPHCECVCVCLGGTAQHSLEVEHAVGGRYYVV